MKVFLSFASPDRSIAEEIQLAILGAGHEVFFDQANLLPGSDYNSRIRDSIEQSDVFVFLITPNSVGKARYAQTELKIAKAKWKKPWGAVLPVMISPTEFELIDPYLAAVTILEPCGNIAAEVAAAVADVSQHASDSPQLEKDVEQQRLGIQYFVYISPTKVAMLYPQIPRSFIDSRSLLVDELPQRCQAVAAYLREIYDLGTIVSPKSYISDTLPLKYGVVSEYASDIAFFGGIVGDTRLGLIGSSASLVGSAERAEANHAPYYYTLKFLNGVLEQKPRKKEQPPYYSFSDAIDIAINALPSKTYTLEFIAKILHKEANLIVATPVYVALAE